MRSARVISFPPTCWWSLGGGLVNSHGCFRIVRRLTMTSTRDYDADCTAQNVARGLVYHSVRNPANARGPLIVILLRIGYTRS